MDKVSIVLPIYNSQNTLKETILSILNQTYTNLEIIAINDGSTDNSDKICKEIAQKDKRLKYSYRSNKGVSYTRNEAIRKSTGKYIMFIDSDDKYKSDTIEKMVSYIENYELVICGYERINLKTNRSVIKKIKKTEFLQSNFEEMIKITQKNNLFNQIWNKIYKSQIIKENNILFDESISLGEDFKFVLDYVSKCRKVMFIDDILYSYINGTEGLNQKFRKNKLEIRTKNSLYLWDYFMKNNYDMNYAYHDYLISCASGLKNFNQIADKREQEKEILKFIKNQEIKEKLKIIIKYTTNIKDKLYAKTFLSHSSLKIKLVIFILSKIDVYNKKKLGY